MAKPKHQKQQESISRKRDYFRKHAYPDWVKCQPKGDRYEHVLRMDGEKAAKQMAWTADVKLMKAAGEAQVDRHGNAIV